MFIPCVDLCLSITPSPSIMLSQFENERAAVMDAHVDSKRSVNQKVAREHLASKSRLQQNCGQVVGVHDKAVMRTIWKSLAVPVVWQTSSGGQTISLCSAICVTTGGPQWSIAPVIGFVILMALTASLRQETKKMFKYATCVVSPISTRQWRVARNKVTNASWLKPIRSHQYVNKGTTD